MRERAYIHIVDRDCPLRVIANRKLIFSVCKNDGDGGRFFLEGAVCLFDFCGAVEIRLKF